MPDFRELERRAWLEELDHQAKLLFSLLCAERLRLCLNCLPKVKRNADPDIASRALEYLFRSVTLQSVGTEDEVVRRMLTDCEAMIPEWDEQNYNWAAQATEAGMAITSCLSLYLEDDVQYVLGAADAVVEGVYLHVRSKLGSRADTMRASEYYDLELMQRELAKQKEDVRRLGESQNLDATLVAELRKENEAYLVQVAED